MKKFRYLILSLLLLPLLISQKPSHNADGEHIPGDVIVMLNPDGGRSSGEILDDLTKDYTRLELTPVRELSGRLNIWLMSYNQENVRAAGMLQLLKAHPGIIEAQNNHLVSLRQNIPSDTDFNLQWNMHNVGQGGGTFDADIDGPEAWDIATGGVTATGDTIVIAVIDNGFQLDHPDIEYWKNNQEIPSNGIDDDGNGYIDDYDGWNAYNQSPNFPNPQSHGTHVTGIAGAIGDNDRGVTGVNWNSLIMPVAGQSSLESIVVEAYSYVYEMRKRYNDSEGATGAFVVVTNSSFGVDFGNPEDFPIWAAMYDSLGQEGVLSAGATMNSNVNIDEVGDIPTSLPNEHLITVNNSDRNDNHYPSGWGIESIDLSAPGRDIWSTNINDGYSKKTGTSMATPHVAGAVALLFAAADSNFMVNYHENPGDVALLIKNFILESTDPIPDMEGKTVTGGRLNVVQAIQRMMNQGIIANPMEINEDTFPNHTLESEFTLTNTGDLAINYTLEIQDPTGWINVSPASGMIDPQGNTQIQVDFDTEMLQAGIYTNSILVHFNDEFIAVQVRLELSHPVIPNPLYVDDEIITGHTENYIIYFNNISEETVNYIVSLENPLSWIEITPISGSIPGTSSRGIMVLAETGDTPIGQYPNIIRIVYDNTDTVFVPFDITIKNPDIISPTDSISVELLPEDSESTYITLTNTTDLPVNVKISTETEATWIDIDPDEATIVPQGSFNAGVEINSYGLIPAIYNNNLVITYKDSDELKIPVVLDVIDTGIEDVSGPFSGLRVNPNPVNREAKISFHLKETSDVSIELYNLNGSFIKQITSQVFPQGQNQISWFSSGLSGTYLIKLSAGRNAVTRKVVIVK